jgi:hydrogenase maturation protein HypF
MSPTALSQKSTVFAELQKRKPSMSETGNAGLKSIERLRLDMTGAVQGVGFRPFIHRLAVSEGLGGFVQNTGDGVSVEIEGTRPALNDFLSRLDGELKSPARIHERRTLQIAPRGQQDFVIAASADAGKPSALVLPDLATCPACVAEIFDPSDRRYRYPFTTCTHCGPRFSIIEAVPYDRVRTAMRRFQQCTRCRTEYEDPASRRFHAEANACPDCGPQLALWGREGKVLAVRHEALCAAADALRKGSIVALKGFGGFQLLADAGNEAAVRRLRQRKRRLAKPFAVMVPTLADALTVAKISDDEQQLLGSAAAPIVLLMSRNNSAAIAPSVAPGNARLGVMLPPTPLHHLLLAECGFAVVATSGNRGDEPIVIDEVEAVKKLAEIADYFLVHDRPILHRVDDSVAQVVDGRETVIRCARGYAPLPLASAVVCAPMLAVGGQQKNAVAVANGRQIMLGPHIGDLGGSETRTAFASAVSTLSTLHGIQAQSVACDQHPDYHSTHFARRFGADVRAVPHHIAHVLAGMTDNGLDGEVLGVAWDGTGYGRDGTIWGGEFLAVQRSTYRRVAYLKPFRLPGGEAAVREPRRTAFGVLYEMFGAPMLARTELPPIASFSVSERHVLTKMLSHGVNSPWTSSVGRLFDAVAALLGFCQKTSFEGEGAIAVESAAARAKKPLSLPAALLSSEGKAIIDWQPTVEAMLAAHRGGAAVEELAAAFHDVLAEVIVAVAGRAGIDRVLLTGGCFQNARLTELAAGRLRQAGFEPYWHHRVPPNDGGLAVGQLAFAARPLTEEIS